MNNYYPKNCEICGDPHGAHYNHEECAKETQRIHADDKRKKRDKKINKKGYESMASYAKKHYE